ncbi:hypothetical protein FRC06_011887 [Ceratobasidium sp. 370]|nr:hypothetical protein FRC06_011887 [Ceratobasidium sp. 370]
MGRGSVVAGAAPQLTHPLYHAEFPVYANNLLAILRAVFPCVNKSVFPIREEGRTLFKFIHGWFNQRNPEELECLILASNTESSSDEKLGAKPNGFDHSQINLEELDSDCEPPFQTINTPVQPRNYPILLEAAKTHSFNPLCVYMHGHHDSPLLLAEYSTVLPGAIAQVTFTLLHKS